MRRPPSSFLRFLALAAAALCVADAPVAAQASGEGTATVVYLVRHAETTDEAGGDPPLSAAGEARAAVLARTLADAGITGVYTTPYRRTAATAAGVADALGLEAATYDPRDPAAMLSGVRAGGRFLVVGHSNTVPALVRALGGEPGEPIGEDEHDRLYIVVVDAGRVTTVLLRQGSGDIPHTSSGLRPLETTHRN